MRVGRPLVVSGPDAHGVSLAAARLIVLKRMGWRGVDVFSRYPETTPRRAHEAFVELASFFGERPLVEVLDIPVNVENPDAYIAGLSRLASKSDALILYDHHESTAAFTERLLEAGVSVVVVVARDAAALIEVIGARVDRRAFEVSLVGAVADRDKSVLRLVDRARVVGELLPLARRLDVLVRDPSLVGCPHQGCVALLLAEAGLEVLRSLDVEYPPERLAARVRVLGVSGRAALADFTVLPKDDVVRWTPKTMEVLAERLGVDYVVALVPAYDAKTGELVGYDVRAVKHWLSDAPGVKRLLEEVASGRAAIVGHEDYASARFKSVEEAWGAARLLYSRLAGEVGKEERREAEPA